MVSGHRPLPAALRPIALLLIVLLSAAADPSFDPATGYRVAQYRGIVPGPPPGVSQVDARAVARLVDRHAAILVDVVPAEGGIRDPATGRWRLAKPAASIPGAAWFPEAGRGVPDSAIARWFLAGVRRLLQAHPRRSIVVFCLADCWMSWNAALRLHRAGIPVLWFGEGSDGWRDLGRALKPVTPFPPEDRPPE